MISRNFNNDMAVVISQNLSPISQKLMPAKESEIRVEKGGFHLRAKSDGTTLLIVPMEYSHCLQVTTLSGAMPEVMRVDVALTGILFDKEVDIRFAQEIGLFTHPACRMQDYWEFVNFAP